MNYSWLRMVVGFVAFVGAVVAQHLPVVPGVIFGGISGAIVGLVLLGVFDD